MACGNKNAKTDNIIEFGKKVLNVVVIGEAQCGKTTFIRAIARVNNAGPEMNINGVRVYSCEFNVNGAMRTINFFEIPNYPGFSIEQRISHYEKADAMVFMYAVDDPSSLEMLSDRWIPEAMVIMLTNSTPVVLLGSKNDLRLNQQVIDRLAHNNQVPVTCLDTACLFPAYFPNSITLEVSSFDYKQILFAYINIHSLLFPKQTFY